MFIPFSHVYLPIPANKKVLTQKCHFSTSQGDKTPSYKGGQEKSWHQLKQSTIFGEFHDKPPFKITTQHTCIVCSVSISPPKIDIPIFTNKIMGLVSKRKLCERPWEGVNYTYWNPTNESRKISVATRPKPAKAWQGFGWLVGWDWLGWWVGKISQDGLKVYGWWIESLKKICQVWGFLRFETSEGISGLEYQLSAKCRM